ncbi:MAG: hypothetical protein COV95_01205 [Candidatus Zambryskibacteria bacterium CG11_big_fil_rev_8_21_14_0_20_40_24]|uniref:Uncharacterized protein n=1 Tax=Candidatus Zambryskibacteria bacterium CG11_big_fil_rev_8_21_14_0_20_40_24 TaxID=1975116 RepID=A0A2H0K6V4_9BACT|nr:MAG: hypothetical protein COV95_01205 [Candidatus Zambryskibacteria bacterium CG11_big_fil_rev_8_21_14_0_20_40_24]
MLFESVLPSPEHDTVYVVVCVGLSVSCPDIGRCPLKPPEILQPSAFVDDQYILVDSPENIEEFATEIETDGPEDEDET